MSAGCVAGSATSDSDRTQSRIFARARRRRIPAHRCGELCFAQGGAANGRQRSRCSRSFGRLTSVEIIGIVVNEKGAERAIATEAVSTLGYPYSISETFLRRNQNQSPRRKRDGVEANQGDRRRSRAGMVAYISMAFGNPYGDPWNEAESCGSRADDRRPWHSLHFPGGHGRSGGAGTDSSRCREVLHDDSVRSNWAFTCTAHGRARPRKSWRRTMPVAGDSIARWADWAVVLSRKTNSWEIFRPKKSCARWSNAA